MQNKKLFGKATAFATIATVAGLVAFAEIAPAEAKGMFDFGCSSSKEADQDAAVEPAKVSKEKGQAWVHSKVLIKAPPDMVWYSVHEERNHDPEIAYSKIIDQQGNEATLEQKFNLIPVIGSATCVMNQKEIANERIDYKLLKSDHFKAMEGSWILTPAEDGKSTILELSTHVDLGLPVPKAIMHSMTAKKIERRLAHVKHMAESNHAQLAVKSHVASKAL